MATPELTRTITARVKLYAESGPRLLELADIAAQVFAGGVQGAGKIASVELEDVNTTSEVTFTTDPATVKWGATAVIGVQVLGTGRRVS